MTRVSFQGERGAYSEEAAVSLFAGAQTVPCPTFHDALECAIEARSDCAILPVENSLEGGVGESSDLLYMTPLHVTAETYHRIEHCLIGTGELGGITTVYSHPQALGQCRKFIAQNSMRTVPTYDTAGSVAMIKKLGRADAACIASKNAAEIHGVPVIRTGIADSASNYTRFLVLSKNTAQPTERDKTSIVFSVRHRPSALYRIVECFHKSGVNLTKIESRPKRDTAWEYNFYVDFEGGCGEQKISQMLDAIKKDSLFFRVLGSYPMSDPA